VDRLTEEMSQLRGRKGTDYPRLLLRLELILPKAKTDVQRIRLLILFVNTRFDSVRTAKARLSAKDWRASVDNIKSVLRLLRANPSYRLVELDAAQEEDEEAAREEEGVEGVSKVLRFLFLKNICLILSSPGAAGAQSRGGCGGGSCGQGGHLGLAVCAAGAAGLCLCAHAAAD
jgi:hypothetical protein